MIINDYGIELLFFDMIRSLDDGISFFEFEINLGLYDDDHKPSFDMFLIIFNCMVFQFWVYNINHKVT